MANGFAERWPRWPSGAVGKTVLAVQVGCSVDTLFETAFGNESEFSRRLSEVKGDKDVAVSSWLSTEAEADASSPKPGEHAKTDFKGNKYEGKLRKHSCSSVSMGMKYKVEEIERVVTAQEGKQYVVEACVATTATYGDRMRSIIQMRLEAAGAKSCTWTADFTIVFIASTNAFIKKAIDRGATGGITKNFETTREVLAKHFDVKDKGVAPEEAPAVAPVTQVVPSAPALARKWPHQWLHAEYVHAWHPASAWMVDQARAIGVRLPNRAAEDLAVVLSICLLCAVLSGALHLLQGTCALAHSLPGPVARTLAAWLAWVDVPASLRSALLGAALLVACHELLARSAPLLWPSLVSKGRAISRRQSRVTDDGDAPKSGVMYDGYNQALETATAKITDTAGDLCKPVLSPTKAASEKPDKQSSAHAAAFKSGMKNMYRDMREAWNKATTNITDPEFPEPRPKPTPTSRAASMELPPVLPGDVPPDRPLSPTNSGLKSPAANSKQKKASNAGGAASSSQLAAAFNKSSMLASLGLARGSSSGAVTGNAVVAQERGDSSGGSSDGPKEASDVEVSQGSQTSARSASPEPRVPVLEEIFEHERYQPFLAWGHRYPGHFLPTDRVGHWGVLNGKDAGRDLSNFDEVAPKLLKGWRWLEDDWFIDMGGLNTSAIDNDGWSYAVDFSWLHNPPVPGAGRFKRVRDYVRRRRWVRTRVPDDSAAPTKPSPATPIRTPSPKPGSARASPTRSRLAEAAPAAAAPPPHPVSPASPARRVRIADIEQPHDGSQRSTSAFADPAALQDESLAPEAGLSEAAMSPQRSMRSESHASSPMASGHLLPAPAAGLGTVGASSRSLSCPEDLQDPPDVDPDPSARDQQYNPHLTILPLLESTSPTQQVPAAAFDTVAQLDSNTSQGPGTSFPQPDAAAAAALARASPGSTSSQAASVPRSAAEASLHPASRSSHPGPQGAAAAGATPDELRVSGASLPASGSSADPFFMTAGGTDPFLMSQQFPMEDITPGSTPTQHPPALPEDSEQQEQEQDPAHDAGHLGALTSGLQNVQWPHVPKWLS